MVAIETASHIRWYPWKEQATLGEALSILTTETSSLVVSSPVDGKNKV
jgi:hypothetical protein